MKERLAKFSDLKKQANRSMNHKGMSHLPFLLKVPWPLPTCSNFLIRQKLFGTTKRRNYKIQIAPQTYTHTAAPMMVRRHDTFPSLSPDNFFFFFHRSSHAESSERDFSIPRGNRCSTHATRCSCFFLFSLFLPPV